MGTAEYFHVALSNETGAAKIHEDVRTRYKITDDEKPVGYFDFYSLTVSEPESGASEEFRIDRD